MIEKMKIGHLTCDYISPTDFFALCDTWLDKQDFHHVVTLNPEMVMQAETDQAFAKAMSSADIRVPDGAGLIWARWYLRSSFWLMLPSLLVFPFLQIERVTGIDALQKLASMCAKKKLSVYLLGGTASQTTKTARWLKRHWPDLVVWQASDHLYTIDGPSDIINDIATKKPAVLFVAYGAPKQTLWIEAHQSILARTVKLAVGVGGAFAMLAEERPRAPKIFRQLNIEWLWRLALEPSRLPRIWQATVRFPLLVQNEKHKLHKSF